MALGSADLPNSRPPSFNTDPTFVKSLASAYIKACLIYGSEENLTLDLCLMRAAL